VKSKRWEHESKIRYIFGKQKELSPKKFKGYSINFESEELAHVELGLRADSLFVRTAKNLVSDRNPKINYWHAKQDIKTLQMNLVRDVT
jgi:hypothetical protein